ncbi:MAG TPA: ATP synthase F1 subunit gamma [Bacillota bacterium]|jgi:F-type H+-transporting ATPase subunit gamma|nr:ATP synthase F1 subunit gamma [Peptococcaceae bacterium MAG4]NLW37644.1 F0F1 ATP synthase subunit gamma [Peptococcaceae bacterium]HPZ42711.1 ATP synthase F1 subunit gamma [Bacillota bacterium]HQD76234.1 ATP synthase F1 subunit gamma [Bacillota bacterium]HUM58777.1 ATP synthase F1 subunit gamma [Bacillota bacterium]
MASLRDLRRRIKSIKSTQQITKAMKAVSAARMRKAQDAVLFARPYSKRIRAVLGRLAVASTDVEHPLLAVREPKKIAYIVMTADRGLCGGFNSNVIRAALQEIGKTNVDFELITVGRKGRDFFQRRKYKIAKQYVGLGEEVKYATARDIASFVMEKYSAGEYDEVYLIYSQFINVLVQRPVMHKILPAEPPVDEKTEEDTKKVEYIFEPSAEAVLTELLPKYIENAIFHGLLETKAGFYSAQMTAMDNATKNASEMIDQLTLNLNRARQAQITKEISEIVGGAAALE